MQMSCLMSGLRSKKICEGLRSSDLSTDVFSSTSITSQHQIREYILGGWCSSLQKHLQRHVESVPRTFEAVLVAYSER